MTMTDIRRGELKSKQYVLHAMQEKIVDERSTGGICLPHLALSHTRALVYTNTSKL